MPKPKAVATLDPSNIEPDTAPSPFQGPFLAVTPNPLFNGKTLGVQFNDGKAIFDANTIRKDYNRDASEVARLMVRDHHYKVTTLDGKPVFDF